MVAYLTIPTVHFVHPNSAVSYNFFVAQAQPVAVQLGITNS